MPAVGTRLDITQSPVLKSFALLTKPIHLNLLSKGQHTPDNSCQNTPIVLYVSSRRCLDGSHCGQIFRIHRRPISQFWSSVLKSSLFCSLDRHIPTPVPFFFLLLCMLCPVWSNVWTYKHLIAAKAQTMCVTLKTFYDSPKTSHFHLCFLHRKLISHEHKRLLVRNIGY